MSRPDSGIHFGFVPSFELRDTPDFEVPEHMIQAHERLLTVFEPAVPPVVIGLQAMVDSDSSEVAVAINGEFPLSQDEWDSVRPEQYVGSLTLLFVQTLTKQVAHIEHVMVDPSFRGRKIGTGLVRLAIGEAKEREVSRIDLTSGASKIEAQGLYAKMGFHTRETVNWRWEVDK